MFCSDLSEASRGLPLIPACFPRVSSLAGSCSKLFLPACSSLSARPVCRSLFGHWIRVFPAIFDKLSSQSSDCLAHTDNRQSDLRVSDRIWPGPTQTCAYLTASGVAPHKRPNDQLRPQPSLIKRVAESLGGVCGVPNDIHDPSGLKHPL